MENTLEGKRAKVAELKARRATLQAELAGIAPAKEEATAAAGKALASGKSDGKAMADLSVLASREVALAAGLGALDDGIQMAAKEYQEEQAAAAVARSLVIGAELDELTVKIGGQLTSLEADLLRHCALYQEADGLVQRFHAPLHAPGRLSLDGLEAILASYDRATAPKEIAARRQQRDTARQATLGEAAVRVAALGAPLPPKPDPAPFVWTGPTDKNGRPALTPGQTPAALAEAYRKQWDAWAGNPPRIETPAPAQGPDPETIGMSINDRKAWLADKLKAAGAALGVGA